MNFAIDQTTFIVSVIAVISTVIGSYISLRVSLAELKVKVDTLWVYSSAGDEGKFSQKRRI